MYVCFFVIFFLLNPIFIDRYPIFTSISKKNFEESKKIFQYRKKHLIFKQGYIIIIKFL